MSSSSVVRSCANRPAASEVFSSESRTRKRCWRSPKTICVVRSPVAFVGDATKSERLISSSLYLLRQAQLGGQSLQLVVADEEMRRIERCACFALALEPKSSDIDLF